MEVGPAVHLEARMVARMEDLMEVGLEGRLVGRLEGRMVDHLEGAGVLRLYREFLLRVLAPRLEFQQLLLERFLVQGFLLLAKLALLQELGPEFPFLLGRQRLRQTYHPLQRFFHLL